MNEYPPINDYALIGDGRTAALVSSGGSIDWCCLPHFSAPSVFAALLDQHHGGRFQIAPRAPTRVSRRYVGDSNVLESTFHTSDGVLRLTDLMPLPADPPRGCTRPQREILRKVECLSGRVAVDVRFEPRPNYARTPPLLRSRGALGWSCEFGARLLHLHCDVPLDPTGDGVGLRGHIELSAGEKRWFSLTYADREVGVILPLGDEADRRIEQTRAWWQEWSNGCAFRGPYRDRVVRSMLTLKMLTYALSGAVVAAPTASLPEKIGGVRNWDYRFCWLRDAAMGLSAFIDLDYRSEGEAFLGWLLHATRLTAPELQVLYDVYGETDVPEKTLAHLEGYRGSRPVRVGNGAWSQRQLDVYGELVLAAYSYVERGGRLDRYEQRILTGAGKVVCRQWKHPDKGVWESRGAPAHHTHSKLMCWVALDRLLKLHQQGHLRVPYQRFHQEMIAIRAAIEKHGYSERVGAYVGVFDGHNLDAALLLMSRYGFTQPNAPRMRSTFARIERSLTRGALVFRYRDRNDALPSGEGAFGVCSFWAVDYLARAGRVEEAEQRLEQLLAHGNDLGLFAEEYDPDSGEALGNFPQAFTHIGAVSAILSLAAAKGERTLQ